MYLPEPLLALALCYLTDGEPARRILRRSEPALGRARGRDWGETRRLLDVVAYQLRREMKHQSSSGPVRMVMVIEWEEDDWEWDVCDSCISNLFNATYTNTPDLKQNCWARSDTRGLAWDQCGGDGLSNSLVLLSIIARDDEYYCWDDDYRDDGNRAVFVGSGLFMDRDDMRDTHNGWNVFVI
jgi:hypothetical protein